MANRRDTSWVGTLLAALLALLCVVPLVLLVVRGAVDGLDPFRTVLAAESTGAALTKSLLLGTLSGVVAVAVALPAAWFSQVTDMPGARAFRVLLVLPLAVPSYVSGFVVMAAFAHNGWLHGLLRPFGFEDAPDVYSLWGVVLALTWAYPLALLQIQAALSRTDPAMWGAARTLGAGPWRAFADVVLPALRAPMATGGLLVGLYAIGDFGAVSLLRFESLSYLVYLRHKSLFARAEVVPLSLLLAVVALVLVVIVLVVGGRTARGARTLDVHRAWPTIELGRWRWVAFAFCATLVLVFVGLPLGVVGYWLTRGLRLGAELRMPWDDAAHSAILGGVSALILVVAAIGPALAHRFGRVGGARALRTLTFVGYALPGIVVALSMVSFVVRWVEPLYQTFGLLVIAYVIRFTPLALGTLEDGLQRVGTGLMDAARTLGASRARATLTVILPSAAPAIGAAALGVFIAVVKELPAALILGPLEYDTLSTRIWTLTEDAFYALAAVPIFMMLGVALIGLIAGRRLSR